MEVEKMQYEKPSMIIKKSEEQDIITLSNGQNGDGPVVDPTNPTRDGFN